MNALVLSLALLQAAPAVDVDLPISTQIDAYVDEHLGASLELLEAVVEINSGSLNPEGVRATGDLHAARLESLGFAVEWVEQPAELGRGPHLVGRRVGSGPHVLLIGHLDTVFEANAPFQDFRIDGDIAFGPGVLDMMGGNVAILMALGALDAAQALDGMTLTVYFTGDEESPGKPLSVSRADLIEAGIAADVALGFEAGITDQDGDYATIARRSSTGWQVTVEGKRSHSSVIFSEGVGVGAVFEAARILDAFYTELSGEQYLTFNPGLILGGSELDYDPESSSGSAAGKTNVVASTALIRGGLRTISGAQLDSAMQRMRDIVAANHPGTTARIEFSEGYPPMSPTEGNQELFELFDQVSRDLGYGPVRPFDPGKRGAADISFVAGHVDAALAGLGPEGKGSHTFDESLDIPSLAKSAKRTALLLYRIQGMPER